MPLLKRKAFEKSSGSEFLRDDEEVFHCEITDEIFSDYEEYCERIILVNSMVWSCEMTGKPNLTYTEALESEKNARKSLRDFPMELRVPILYLASRTKRCTFAEMLDDVFNFVRDRYFVGETVEACLEGDTWLEGQILSVTAPKQMPTDTNGSPNKPSSLYCYEVEQFDDELDGNALGHVAIVPHDRVRRSRGVFTRDKNKLYLKQFVEQGPGGVIRIKDTTMDKYNIPKVKFDQIFTGPPPEFASSKKFDKVTMNSTTAKGKQLPNGQKKQSPPNKPRQESIAKYMTKVDKFEGTKQSKSMELSKDRLNKLDHKSGKIQKPKNGLVESKSLKDEMKRVGEELKQKKLEEKIKKKEKSVKLAAYLKEWNKQKDDLELEDHSVLPQTIPVEIPGLPNKYFGDFMAIMEFFQEFSKPLKLRDAFHNGVEMEILRRALTTKEVAGPLSDIIQVLLGAIFSLQEDEAEEYNEDRDIQDINDIQENPEDIGMTAMRGIQLATAASKWPQTYMATPLSQLPIDSQTFSEVLRLHLLSSGSGGGDRCAKWRYQQRGGYSSQDDPGLWLRIRKPHVIKALSRKHLTQLPLSYKFTIINCLINQIISYATIRDLIEEKLEKSKNLKFDIRNFQVAERKREAEVILTRQKIRRDAAAKKEEEKLTSEAAKTLDEQVQSELEALHKESENKKAEYEKKLKIMQAECFSYQSYLGSDRAHRRYWVYETISGLFVEHDERFSGICLDKPVTPNPSLATAPPEDTLSYVQRLFENEHGGYSDKENDSANGSKKLSDAVKSPKKAVPENSLKMMQDLLMCTANPNTCPVHSSTFSKTRWSFLYSPEHFDSLVGALNKRGLRENDLRYKLEREKEQIVKYIVKCPVSQLNPKHSPPTVKPEMQTRLTRKYVDANLRFPPGTDTSEVLEMSLRDAVVDLEEKLFMGCLGELQIKDRQAWRDTIIKRGYDKQCNNLTWGPQRTLTDDLHIINGKTKVDAEANAAAYKEPGYFLGATGTAEISDSDNESETGENSVSRDDLPVVKDLACALLQLGQAVSQKYLKRPLGYDEKERLKETKNPLEFDALRRWETSLMECTSFAQVMLHLVILDNSILWSKSILNANCRICRRRTDAENMLLCDLCNKGHHMYCLKPKLTKVPEGDWFCDQCKPKEKTPQKRNRKVFKEEDSGNELDDSNSWDGSVSVALCTSCGSGGVLVQCTVCSDGWHSECLPKPPQRRVAFICPSCSKPKHKNRELDRGVRRCAADAMTNINHYAKMLKKTPRQQSDSESSEEPYVVKTKRKRPSKESSPVAQVNGSSKKSRRSAPVIHSESGDEPLAAMKPHKKRASKECSQLTNGMTNGGTHGKRSTKLSEETGNSRRSSAPSARLLVGFSRKSLRPEALNQPALEELITEVMKHKDSWPFNAPVTVEEVPDYFNIITEPMDFETIKMKLERKKYSSDAQVMADSSLVFNNCFTYNHEEDAVAKAGVRLQKFFDKRCKELNLPGISGEEFSIKESSKKKNRTLN